MKLWGAHRAAIASSSSVRLEHHIVVHRQLSVLVHENLRSPVRALEKSDPLDWSSMMNPFDGAWSTAAANQTRPRKPFKTYTTTRRVSNTAGSEAHRAAICCSSVCLERHGVVHRQLSVGVQENLRSAVRALGKSDPLDWSSITNPFDGAWSTPAANQTNPSLAKPIAEYHFGNVKPISSGRLTAPKYRVWGLGFRV